MLVGGEKGARALVVSALSTPHSTAHLRMFLCNCRWLWRKLGLGGTLSWGAPRSSRHRGSATESL